MPQLHRNGELNKIQISGGDEPQRDVLHRAISLDVDA